MRLALYQPDIPQNAGTLIRLGACLGVPIDLIEPCGFVLTDRHLKRSAMDYVELAAVTRHLSWSAFRPTVTGRLILVETDGAVPYWDFAFRPDDTLMVGRESAGTPSEVSATCDAAVFIPMRLGARSLNVAVAAAMVLGEAVRQTRGD